MRSIDNSFAQGNIIQKAQLIALPISKIHVTSQNKQGRRLGMNRPNNGSVGRRVQCASETRQTLTNQYYSRKKQVLILGLGNRPVLTATHQNQQCQNSRTGGIS